MQTTTVTTQVVIPSAGDVGKHYNAFSSLLNGVDTSIFDAVVRPETFVEGAAISDIYEAPAVAAVAARISALEQARGLPLSDHEKRYVGALVCALMEANGYEKVPGLSKRVGVPPFTRGQVYRRKAR